MPTKFYIAEVIGSGTRKDPYRPACSGTWKEFSAAIPTDDKGIPLANTCVVKVSDEDQSSPPKGVTEIPDSDKFIAEIMIREEQRKLGETTERIQLAAETARIVDQVKEVGGDYATYELKQFEEMLGVDTKDSK